MLYQDLCSWSDAEDLTGVHPMMPGYRLLRLDGRVKFQDLQAFEIVMLCDTTREVVYYSRSYVLSTSSIKPSALTISWRSRDYQHDSVLKSIATNVLTSYILSNYNAIVSDGNQNTGGKFFWESQISAAMSHGNNAYFYNVKASELEHIKGRIEFKSLKDFIWSEEGASERNVVIISKDELPLDHVYKLPMDIIEALDNIDVENGSYWNGCSSERIA